MNRSAFRFPKPADPLRLGGGPSVTGATGNDACDVQSERYHRYLFALQFCAGQHVLDIASGEGYGSYCLGQVAETVVGVDTDAAAVSFANQNYLTERVSFKLGTAKSIPIVDASIDVVTSFETLEHLTEHEAFKSEIRRVLRPNGLLVISLPNRMVDSQEADDPIAWHPRKLDRSNFVNYLTTRFANVRMFVQRPLAGSVIAIDDASNSDGQPEGFILRGEGLFQRTRGIPDPQFFIALASEARLPQVSSSVLQHPILLQHIDLQRQKAVDDAARAVAKMVDIEKALLSSRNEEAALVLEAELIRCDNEQKGGELRRQLRLGTLSAGRIQTIRQELTAARRRNRELSHEVDSLRQERDQHAREAGSLGQERDQRASEVDSLRQERDQRASEADNLRRERDQRANDADNLRRERDEHASDADNLRRERASNISDADNLRQERDHYETRLNSICQSTIWRATWPLRRLGSILPLGARRALHSGAAMELAVVDAGPTADTSDPLPSTLTSDMRPPNYADAAPEPPTVHAEAAGYTPDPLPPTLTFNTPLPGHADAAAEPPPAPTADADADAAGDTPDLLAPTLTSDTGVSTSEEPPTADAEAAGPIPDAHSPALSCEPAADQTAENQPSQRRRQLDASWVEPNERPEFRCLSNVCPTAKIAVVAHIHHPDVWHELAQALFNIPEAFDLFITLVSGDSESLARSVLASFPDAHVLLVDAHGRDIFPLLALLRTGVLFNYELICKIRSKHDNCLEDSDERQRSLSDSTLVSTEVVTRILGAFRSDPDLGIVVSPGQIIGGRANWVSTEAGSSELLQRLGLNESVFEQNFADAPIYWIRPFILRPIDALRLGFDDFESEPKNDGGCTARAVERLFSVICHDAGMRLTDSANLVELLPAPRTPRVHIIANYLPQYHPIPENDAWWGKGFTEWTNVTKAQPLFRGHRQPRLPTEMGFYDLRLPQIRRAQADLARSHGVTAFSYYYYWFNGRKLLNGPIEDVVASGEPDFPFMLCWANEPWTRNWDGLTKEILMPQDYAPGWELAFAADVAKIMRDRRYMRLNGKPVLALYRVAHFPDKKGSITRLRSAFNDEGLPAVHMIGAWVQIGNDEALPMQPGDIGLDAYFEFPPHGIPSQPSEIPAADRGAQFAAHTYDYDATVDAATDQIAIGQAGFRYRGVMMGWDNTARRGNQSFAFHGATPANFRRWLRAALRCARAEAREGETALFINAWNEWAEGTYLEPDREFGRGWLEAVASATAAADPRPTGADSKPETEIEGSHSGQWLRPPARGLNDALSGPD